ncbi:MAG: Uroporphyrinogen synthase [Gammaproteobacteria bacterium]|jgi:uroporphyrinogen-III synthase|nr:Uroporphyrinogen synthase [Gammaproteobacteria bacterium]
MIQQAELENCKVLVTRPEPQAKDLARHIQALGGIPVLLPCIIITPAHDLQSLIQAAETLNSFDIAIFISPNAVDKVVPVLKKYWPVLPKHLKIACVGEGTARTLANYQITVDFYPKAHFNSEELLTLPELQNIAGKHIVLFKGEGGKPLLADTLQQRGANIHKAIAYRRSCPEIDIEPLLTRWQNAEIEIIVSTSQEALDNFIRLIGKRGEMLLQHTALLVISPAMEQAAKQLGLNKIILAENATDQAIIAALIQYRKQLNG